MDKEPAFTLARGYVFDLKPFRNKIKDNIAFLDMTELDSEIIFYVYYIHPDTGEWVKNRERGKVKEYNDRDIVDLDKGVKLKNVPYIAIVPDDDDKNEYEFKLYPQSHDIYIEIGLKK